MTPHEQAPKDGQYKCEHCGRLVWGGDHVCPDAIRAADAAPLAALVMRDAAAERVQLCADYIEEPMTIPQLADLAKELREIPIPDEAALTAAALTLPKVKALVDAAEWQPISTAPKDETAVLLLFAMRAAEYAKWSDEKLEPYRLQALSVEVGFFQGGEWCEAGTGHDFFEEWRRSDYPTHWMPLPAPPDTALTPASKGSPK